MKKKKGIIIAVANQKGGCGKTTTAINLSAALTLRDFKVLLIDLDAQSHASLGIGVDVDRLICSVYDVVVRNVELPYVIIPTDIKNLNIAPATFMLSDAQLEMLNLSEREQVLRNAIYNMMDTSKGEYDYIILDCSSSLNLLSVNGLVAADFALIPIQANYFSLEGMKELFSTIKIIKERLNPSLEILGILPTLYSAVNKMNKEILHQIRDYFQEEVFKTVISLDTKLADAAIFKKSIFDYAPGSPGAKNYLSLTEEVVLLTTTGNIPRPARDKDRGSIKSGEGKNIVEEIFEHRKTSMRRPLALFKSLAWEGAAGQEISEKAEIFDAAIDIGGSSIKLVQLVRGKKGQLEIINFDEEHYAGDAGADDRIFLKGYLERIIERNKVKKVGSVTIPVREVQTYYAIFSLASENDLAPAVREKVIQFKPFGLNIDQIVYQYIRLSEPAGFKKSSQQKVLIICVPQEVISARKNLFSELGLKITNIEIPPVSLMNISNILRERKSKSAPHDKEITLWIDLGRQESFLAIEARGRLCFLRSLSVTSQDMTKAVMGHCQLTQVAAEEAKKEYGLSFWAKGRKIPACLDGENPLNKNKDNAAAVYYALISLIDNLTMDIEQSFKYFSYQITQSQTAKFDRLILCGGGSNLKNLDSFLEARLGVAVDKLDPFSIFPLRGRNLESGRHSRMNFGVCAGLAAGQNIAQSQSISLMPAEQRKKFSLKKIEMPRRVFRIIGALFLVIVTAIAVNMGYQIGFQSTVRKINDREQKLRELSSIQLQLVKQAVDLLGEKKLSEEKLKFLEERIKTPRSLSKVIDSIITLIPESRVWIDKVEYKNKTLIIKGSVDNVNLIFAIVNKIKGLEEFKDVEFNYRQKKSIATLYDFEITAGMLEKQGEDIR